LGSPLQLNDHEGRDIRLPQERLDHIYRVHSYMNGMEWTIHETLRDPDSIWTSRSDPASVRLYYRWFRDTLVGDKYVCVVVKMLEADAFVLTAYVTTNIQEGEELWRRREG
jgi:hypothetical protein